MITEVDELVRIIEIPELPDAAQTDPNYVHDHWNDLAQHHGASPSESPEEGEGVPTPTSSNLRGYEKDDSHDQLPTPEPTPEPSVPIQHLPAGTQADPESSPPAHPVDDLTDQFQQLQYDFADRLVDTSFRPITSPHSAESEEPPARPKHSISADILPDHIIEGNRTRKPSDRRAVHAATSTQDPYAVFHATFHTLNRTHRPRHQSEMPPVPRKFGALINHPERDEFLEACNVEIHNLDKRDTFKIVDKPNNLFIVPLMWVFDYKFDDNGFLLRHRSRIVVRGDLQPPTKKQTYANTLAMRAWRALAALICAFDLETCHFDAVNAFLNSRLNPDEQIFCHMPDGFKEKGKAWLLLRALYGLTRSPFLWFTELSSTLKDLGFEPVLEEPCILSNGRIIIFFYVDDIIMAFHRRDSEEAATIKARLFDKYEFRDLGELKWFLNIRITRDRENRKLYLAQDSYIDNIIKRFGLEHASKVHTPLSREASQFVPFDGQASADQIREYQERLGSLIYLANSLRIDIAHPASLLARFMHNPSPIHRAEADHIITYLRDHKWLSLVVDGNVPLFDGSIQVFEGASDAAYGDDHATRRSSEGYVFRLYKCPIDWRAIRQDTVTTSTTEAELLALTHTGKQIMWWQRFFKQLGFEPGHEYTLQCDNSQTVGLVNKTAPIITTKLRHVDIQQHWLRERVERGDFKVEWASTNDLIADGLTKPLTRQKHERFVGLLGLVDLPFR
jgi:Reverse transcriptase (RNA-dependent DNA polymerase)